MMITCPKCELSKVVDDDRLADTDMLVTCTRCRTQFEIKADSKKHWILKRKGPLFTAGIVLVVVVLLAVHDWKLDKNYFLQPGAWQGEMTYMGKKYPFDMMIEKARDGHLEGYMDWVGHTPRYRLAIRGTYVGNHLVFEDYEFLERQGTTGLHDEQDVYIVENEMTGTAKHGRAELRALKRESAPF